MCSKEAYLMSLVKLLVVPWHDATHRMLEANCLMLVMKRLVIPLRCVDVLLVDLHVANRSWVAVPRLLLDVDLELTNRLRIVVMRVVFHDVSV